MKDVILFFEGEDDIERVNVQRLRAGGKEKNIKERKKGGGSGGKNQ